MKRWFCGFSSVTENAVATLPKPQKSEVLWEGANPFWLCGPWGKQQVITLFEGPVRVAIVGTCLEPYESLVQVFHSAINSHDYSRLMRLSGSYNVIVQEETDTYVFTDVAGFRPVFYTVYNSVVAYSSIGVALQQLIQSDVNLSWLARQLVGLTEPLQAINQSPFNKVQTVPPGHYLQITNGMPSCKPYWNAPQDYMSLSEGAEQLRERLITAVEGRVNLYGTVTSDLSGGFDSTSLALIAAKHLAKKNRTIHTITLQTDSNLESDDLKCAQHAASLYPNIQPVIVEHDELPADYTHLDEIPLIDSPETSLLCIGTISHVMRIINAKGSQLHMNGEGGDAVVSASHAYLANLLKQGQIRTFLQHAYGWSRLARSRPLPLISGIVKLSFTSYHQSLRQQAKKLITQKRSPKSLTSFSSASGGMGWDSVPEVVGWYTPQLVDLAISEVNGWASNAIPLADSPDKHQAISIIQFNGFCVKSLHQLAQYYDVNVEFPYLDALVIDACLAVKPEERTTPFAFKPLLSKALQTDFPGALTRTTKSDYTADEFIGLRQNLRVINELLQTSVLADTGLIDIREFRAAVQQFNMGIVNNGFSAFSQTFAMELWLRRLLEPNAKNCFWE